MRIKPCMSKETTLFARKYRACNIFKCCGCGCTQRLMCGSWAHGNIFDANDKISLVDWSCNSVFCLISGAKYSVDTIILLAYLTHFCIPWFSHFLCFVANELFMSSMPPTPLKMNLLFVRNYFRAPKIYNALSDFIPCSTENVKYWKCQTMMSEQCATWSPVWLFRVPRDKCAVVLNARKIWNV